MPSDILMLFTLIGSRDHIISVLVLGCYTICARPCLPAWAKASLRLSRTSPTSRITLVREHIVLWRLKSNILSDQLSHVVLELKQTLFLILLHFPPVMWNHTSSSRFGLIEDILCLQVQRAKDMSRRPYRPSSRVILQLSVL